MFMDNIGVKGIIIQQTTEIIQKTFCLIGLVILMCESMFRIQRNIHWNLDNFVTLKWNSFLRIIFENLNDVHNRRLSIIQSIGPSHFYKINLSICKIEIDILFNLELNGRQTFS